MKKIVILLFIIAGLWSCDDNDIRFEGRLAKENITFTPIPGGAEMRYNLEDPSVFSIKVRYINEYGKEVVKRSTFASSTIELRGFNKAHTGVPVFISVLNEKDEESENIEMAFDTEESAVYAFFNNIKVEPYWNGFKVTYDAPEDVEGFANVYYVGINPMTKKREPLLLSTFLLQSGGGTQLFPLQEINETNTVIIKTEDFKGNVAREQIWEEVASYNTDLLDNSNFDLLDPFNLSKEDGAGTGKKYLFDGDTKGSQRRMEVSGTRKYFSFIAGPYAVGKHWILDIKDPKVVSSIRLYAMLNVGNMDAYPSPWDSYTSGTYQSKLPNEVTIYASNDLNDDASWVKIGYFHETQAWLGNASNRWYWKTSDGYPEVKDIYVLKDAKPAYMDINLDVTLTEYRYFKIEVNNIFEDNPSIYYRNTREYVTFHEIEVFTKIN